MLILGNVVKVVYSIVFVSNIFSNSRLIQKHIKVGFFQKVMAKSSNLSNRHACEPNIVLEPLFPVHIVNIRIVLF